VESAFGNNILGPCEKSPSNYYWTMKTIIKYPNYSIDEYGNVFNNKFNKYLGWCPHVEKGKVKYYSVHMPDKTQLTIHKAVYQTYIGPIPKGYIVHHKDLNPANNHFSNLVAMTRTDHVILHQILNRYGL